MCLLHPFRKPRHDLEAARLVCPTTVIWRLLEFALPGDLCRLFVQYVPMVDETTGALARGCLRYEMLLEVMNPISRLRSVRPDIVAINQD
jgi:hypothetical protein